MTYRIDNPHVRHSSLCPVCHEHKDEGLVTCWPCYRTGGKYGDHDAIIEAAEHRLAFQRDKVSQSTMTPDQKRIYRRTNVDAR